MVGRISTGDELFWLTSTALGRWLAVGDIQSTLGRNLLPNVCNGYAWQRSGDSKEIFISSDLFVAILDAKRTTGDKGKVRAC